MSSRAHPDLAGHVALVTGGNHGIGAATARHLADAGAAVVITYLRLADPPDPGTPPAYRQARATDGRRVAAEITKTGGRAIALEADLSDERVIASLFDAAESELGPVDILVNNASGWVADTFDVEKRDRFGRTSRRVSADTVDLQFAVDARATALLISEYARRHSMHGLAWGRIVGLSSGGPLGFPGEVSYGAAKAALENYTMSAAFELGGRGVTANVVHPPVTDTGWVTDEIRRHVSETTELMHVAQPYEVAEAILFLVSEEARLVTGNVIHLR